MALVSTLSLLYSALDTSPVCPKTTQGMGRKLIQRALVNACTFDSLEDHPFLPRCSFEKSQWNQNINLVSEEKVF